MVPDKKKIRVLIADDFKVLRDVIRLYLERTGDFEVVDEAPDVGSALEQARPLATITGDIALAEVVFKNLLILF